MFWNDPYAKVETKTFNIIKQFYFKFYSQLLYLFISGLNLTLPAVLCRIRLIQRNKLISFCSESQINNNTDRTLGVVFSRFRCFFVHNNSEAEAKRSYAHAALNFKTKIHPVQRRMSVTPFGFCLRVIVNKKHLNLEKTTPSVLSVLFLIYAPKSQQFQA